MSDSDEPSTSHSIPPDATIESLLRHVVHLAVREDDTITVNIARSRAEKELGLHAGFFKEHAVWKEKSRQVISDAINDPESPGKPIAKASSKAGAKRKSDEAPLPRKKSKTSASKPEVSDPASSPVQEVARSNEPDATVQQEEEGARDPPAQTSPTDHVDDDDSDLSSVIDDAPPRKRRSKKGAAPVTEKSRPTKPSKATNSNKSFKDDAGPPDKGKELSPDDEEIKRLQSWLVKCGVRKVWHRELAPYDTTKAKIRHLKGMLEEVGMSGRFSAEKARQIKEARELKDELDAARQFNEQWGHDAEDGSDEAEESDQKPDPPIQKRRPKGLVDFGDSDEDSD